MDTFLILHDAVTLLTSLLVLSLRSKWLPTDTRSQVSDQSFFQGQSRVAKKQAGTKVGPDQLRPPVRVGSTRIDSDQLRSMKKTKIK